MRRPLPATIAAAIVAAGLLVTTATPAAAAGDRFWYYTDFGVADAHAQGLTGEGVQIAVIDGQIDPEVPTLANSTLKVMEPSACLDASGQPVPAVNTAPTAIVMHSVSVASLIVGTGAGYNGDDGVKGVAPGADLRFYAASDGRQGNPFEVSCTPTDLDADGEYIDGSGVGDALRRAIDDGAQIISVSLGGFPSDQEVQQLARAYSKGIVVLGGTADTVAQRTSNPQYPGGGNGSVAVSSFDSDLNLITDGGSGTLVNPLTTVAGPGQGVASQGNSETGDWSAPSIASGTSFATPIVAGVLALVKQKYPDATGNQLIQTLIRNTYLDDHALEYEKDSGFGYGAVSLRHLLEVDPTGYDDVNPLIKDTGGKGYGPTLEQIAAAGESSDPSASPDPTGEPGDQPAAPSLLPILLGVGIGVVLLIVVVVIVIVVVLRRRNRGSGGPA